MLIHSPFPPELTFVFRALEAGEDAGLATRLTPEERGLLDPRATPKRVADFALGRDCGREALRRLGVWREGAPSPSILRKERMPVWPPGFVGSLAHSRGAAAAVVGPASRYRGLGVDVERLDRDASAAMRRTLRPDEREALAHRGPALAMLWFCVKESIFKALYPATGMYLGFQDARVRAPSVWPDLSRAGAGTLEWELLKASGDGFPVGMRGAAGWRAEPPWLVAGVWVPAGAEG